MEYFLKTARLGFRCWSDADLPLALELWGDPEVNEFLVGPFTPDTIRKRLEREIAQMQECGLQYWPIFLLDGDAHVGCAGLQPYRMQERVYELGFHLRPAFWGSGLAQEAALGLIEHAFGALNATALFAGHHPMNQESRRVLLKVGFVYTGDALYPPSGVIEPAYLLRKEPALGLT
jgi:RimJ/RimL family protein N-acetyltransferase